MVGRAHIRRRAGRRCRERQHILLLLATLAAPGGACSGSQSAGPEVPTWRSTTVDWGQGQISVGLRFRWVAERDTAGVVVRTAEGGEATVRVFSCGKSRPQIEALIRERLRGRLQANEFLSHGPRTFGLRYWQGKEATGAVRTAVVKLYGPLLIAVASGTLEQADLVGVAERVRLTLPLATIPSCLPLCDVEDAKCVPQGADDEGAPR